MLQIHIIPALKDNYFWLLQPDIQQPDAYIIDPGDDTPVIDTLNKQGLQLKGMLITHHHNDHTGGIEALKQKYQVPVYGPQSARIPQITHFLKDGDKLLLGNLYLEVIGLPGHTLDHIAYFITQDNSAPILFSGDTIFGAGCGRLFDGTAPLLHAALQKIATLPNQTIIYAAHEYTCANIRFARFIDPDNADLAVRETIENQKRANNLPTLPTNLALEKRTNPFLRCHLSAIHKKAEELSGHKLLTEADVFASLRRAKDQF